MKLNNEGQVLIVFIVLIPILLMLFTFVIDLGLLGIEKRNISNEIKDSIEYGLDNITDPDIENKINNLLIKNIDDISLNDINIEINGESIKINVKKEYKTLFNIIGKSSYNIDVTYSGTLVNNEIRINKE